MFLLSFPHSKFAFCCSLLFSTHWEIMKISWIMYWKKAWKLPTRPQKIQCWFCIPRAAADSKEGSAHFLAKAVCSVDQKPKSPLPLLEPALLSRSRVIVVRIGLKLFFHFIQDQQVVNQPGTTSCVSLIQEKEGEEACPQVYTRLGQPGPSEGSLRSLLDSGMASAII